MGLRHRLAHWLGWNRGTVETWWSGDVMLVGFRCVTCGRLGSVGVVPRAVSHPDEVSRGPE